jgi:hypothetical protein
MAKPLLDIPKPASTKIDPTISSESTEPVGNHIADEKTTQKMENRFLIFWFLIPVVIIIILAFFIK